MRFLLLRRSVEITTIRVNRLIVVTVLMLRYGRIEESWTCMIVSFLVAMHMILIIDVFVVVIDNVIIFEIVFWIFIRCNRLAGIRAARIFRIVFRWFFHWFLRSVAASFVRSFVFRRIQRMDAIFFAIFIIVGVVFVAASIRTGT